MPNFIPYDLNQSTMIVVNFGDQLPRGTFEHAINYLIENKLDLSIFHDAYHNEYNGRPAFNPAVLLKIILFAYSKGITSSREIQWCCERNVTFKALSCDTVPHFTTIAHFISAHPKAIHNIFEQIVLTCYQEGLIGNELFAIDGCKLPSNAAKEWSGTIKELTNKRKKIKHQLSQHMKHHAVIDKQEDSAQCSQAKQRTAQAINTLEKAYNKIDQFLKTAAPRLGEGKRKTEVKSNITDNESAKMGTSKGTIQGYNGLGTADKRHQVVIDAQAFGAGPEQHTLKPIIEAIRDRFSRLKIPVDFSCEGTVITADTGFSSEANMQYLHEQNLNAYVPDNDFRSRDKKLKGQKAKHQHPNLNFSRAEKKAKKNKSTVFTSDDFEFNSSDMTCRCPAGELLGQRKEREDLHGNQKIFFTGRQRQCRACDLKMRCLKNPIATEQRNGRGRQVSFIIEKRKPVLNYTDWMKKRIDTDKGKQIYSHRMSVIEPVFGNICSNKKLNRFSLRGKTKVQGQWQLYCMVHNIEKLMKYGELAA
jgi:transposase